MRRKAQFKSNCTDEVMPGFLAINNEHLVAYAPINGFTRADLGCERGGNMFSMIQQLDAPESKTYLQLFDQLWADKRRMQDVTEQRKRKIDFTKIERYRENNRIEAAYAAPTVQPDRRRWCIVTAGMVHGDRRCGAPGRHAENYSGMPLRLRMDSPSIWMV